MAGGCVSVAEGCVLVGSDVAVGFTLVGVADGIGVLDAGGSVGSAWVGCTAWLAVAAGAVRSDGKIAVSAVKQAQHPNVPTAAMTPIFPISGRRLNRSICPPLRHRLSLSHIVPEKMIGQSLRLLFLLLATVLQNLRPTLALRDPIRFRPRICFVCAEPCSPRGECACEPRPLFLLQLRHA